LKLRTPRCRSGSGDSAGVSRRRREAHSVVGRGIRRDGGWRPGVLQETRGTPRVVRWSG